MRRSGPLRRGKPLKAGGALKRTSVPARTARKRRPTRNTGFSPRVKLMIRTRAGNGDPGDAVCELGGEWLGPDCGDFQHRAARGAGGCRDSVVNGPANGVLLCCPCHAACETRDEHLGMDGAGFWVKHGTTPEFDPRLVPVMWHARAGSGIEFWLGVRGEYLYARPELAAA